MSGNLNVHPEFSFPQLAKETIITMRNNSQGIYDPFENSASRYPDVSHQNRIFTSINMEENDS